MFCNCLDCQADQSVYCQSTTHWDSVTGKGEGGGGGGKGGSMQSMVSPLCHCVSMGYIWVTVSRHGQWSVQ